MGTGTGFALGSSTWGSQSTGLKGDGEDFEMGFAATTSRGTTPKGMSLMDPEPLIPREIKIKNKNNEKDKDRGMYGLGKSIGKMRKLRGNIHCIDLERSSVDFNSSDVLSDPWSDSDDGSIVNTIPPETPALSPMLTGRKGPLPAMRPRFSPTAGRNSKQKNVDLLCLDNYFDEK